MSLLQPLSLVEHQAVKHSEFACMQTDPAELQAHLLQKQLSYKIPITEFVGKTTAFCSVFTTAGAVFGTFCQMTAQRSTVRYECFDSRK